MSDLGWRADGIARALAAGGVVIELHRVPGFARGLEARSLSSEASGGGSGVQLDPDPYYDEDDDE